MSEILSARISRNSEPVFENTEWQNEQRFSSSQPVEIEGYFGEDKGGSAMSTFYIKRDLGLDGYIEIDRFVRLNDIHVMPNMKRRGIGSVILTELERRALRFGATRIEGTISASDLDSEPWLPDFYIRQGFNLTPNNQGYEMVKSL